MNVNIVAVVSAEKNMPDQTHVFDDPESLWLFLSENAVKNDLDFEDISAAQFICKTVFSDANGHSSFVSFFEDDLVQDDRSFKNAITFRITTAHIK